MDSRSPRYGYEPARPRGRTRAAPPAAKQRQGDDEDTSERDSASEQSEYDEYDRHGYASEGDEREDPRRDGERTPMYGFSRSRAGSLTRKGRAGSATRKSRVGTRSRNGSRSASLNSEDELGGLGPSIPSYLQFTPRRAIASFDNLVALANHQERLREARKMVWRDRGEPVIELKDIKAVLLHAGKGGFRAATLAFNLRAAFSLVLALIRIKNVPKDQRVSTIRREVLSMDSFRFASMIGTFVGVYKLLINALPFLPHGKPSYTTTFAEDDEEHGGPVADIRLAAATVKHNRATALAVPSVDLSGGASTGEKLGMGTRAERLSLSHRASMVLVRKKTRRWHAAVAGLIAGAAGIVCEGSKGRRVMIGQQMFVRGLQGVWNAGSEKYGIEVPYGSVIVFSMACGQIMYSWLMRPDVLGRSYANWISTAAHVPRECVRMQNDLCRTNTFNLSDLDALLSRADVTPTNRTIMQRMRAQAISALATGPDYKPHIFPPYTPCATIHPDLTSCVNLPLDKFLQVAWWMLPIYGALHFIPPVLFKWPAFRRDPAKVFVRASLGSVRSSAFLGVFVILFQSPLCYKHHLYALLTGEKPSSFPRLIAVLRKIIPTWLVHALVSKYANWALGFLSGMALFVEEQRRDRKSVV